MGRKYLDQLMEAYKTSFIWVRISCVLFLMVGIQTVVNGILSVKLLNSFEKTQYILSPGIAALTVVRPGELPNSYVEESFRYVTNLLNGWTYSSWRDNYKILFENFYSHELKIKTQANLDAQTYGEDIEKRKLISYWRHIPEESEVHWCGKVSARAEIKGVACGIITGEQSLFADHTIPIRKEKISYLLYAINVAPTPNNLFAIEIMRLKRGPFLSLKEELRNSLENGVLPSEEGDL